MNGKPSQAKGDSVKEAFNRATIKNPHSITDIYRYEQVD
jgi:hypothetical protein